jgi:uncharacterized membrane protein YbaN (DUF454 family)
MIKITLLYLLACVFLVLGLIGLVIPVLPGVLFLLGAAICVSCASPRAHRTFSRSATYRHWRRRWDAGAGLSAVDRARLAFWLSMETTFKAVRDTVRRT